MAEDKTLHGPLRGIVVLDMSQGIAGPSCAGHFAEHGAEVIKLEPPEGDWIRALGGRIAGTSSAATLYNRGKASLALDLKTPEGSDIALKLAGRAHVVVESARPGVMDRLGVGFEAVKARQPDIVYVSISGWGQRGPNRELPMVDTVAQAVSGLMSVMKSRDGGPSKMDSPVIDAITGLYAFQAASMALWGGRKGKGARHIDISLLQSSAHIQGPNLLETSYFDKNPVVLNPPAGNYLTRDGWMAVTLVTEAQFAGICRAIGKPELATDPRYATFGTRRERIPELRAILDEAFARETTAYWTEVLTREGALASRINTYMDWLAHPQVTANEAAPAHTLADGKPGRIPHLPGEPPNKAPVPDVGTHTRDVLGTLGLAAGDIDALIAKGVVKQATDA